MVFENRVLMRMFGPERQGVTGGGENGTSQFVLCSKCYWVIKLRRMRWAGHVACWGRRKMHRLQVFVGKA
jgi:hypothetical protein